MKLRTFAHLRRGLALTLGALLLAPLLASSANGETVTPVARVNFQRNSTVTPAGYLRDYGQAFTDARTYGWVDQSGVATDNSTAGRERNILSDKRLDTFVHMQLSGANLKWEYVVPNGTYRVTVAAGDAAAYYDSTHRVNVEGTQAINFTPTTSDRNRTATVTVPVTDGRLTLDAVGGTNTKVDYVDIDAVTSDPEPPPPGDDVAKVNFERGTSVTPAGYVKDAGGAYTAARGYGWITPGTTTPSANTANTRERNVLSDKRLDTLVQMQSGGQWAWQYALSNGTYEVTFAAGDPSYFDSTHVINVEGAQALNFAATTGDRQRTVTVTRTVSDGFLTIDAIGGTNTKIDYVDIKTAAPTGPYFASTNPSANATNVPTSASVILSPSVSADPSTVTAATFIVTDPNNDQLDGAYNSDAAGGVVNFTPFPRFEPNTKYRVRTTTGIKDDNGNSFAPLDYTFTTGAGGITQAPISFTKVSLGSLPGATSLAIGPDNKLYVSTALGQIFRYTLNADGSANGAPQELANDWENQRTITGLAFEPGSTASNMRLWVSHGYFGFENVPNWTGTVSVLSKTTTDFDTKRDVITGLPRSVKDHMNNGIAFGPDGKLYIAQGSNNGYGGLDNAWGQRAETALSGSILQADVSAIAGTLSVKTAEGGTYNPGASNAPVKVYAEGTRNPYDLLWHSNGSLYTAVNESAGGNTPAGPNNNPPALFGLPAGNDYFAKIIQGKYYGHPNPSQGHYTLNGGNPTSGTDYFEVPQYPVGTQPDANWNPPLYDFGVHRSTNGLTEYKSNVFGAAYNGMVVQTEFSSGDDLLGVFLNASGNVSGVSQIAAGFNNPIDVINGVNNNGNLYVAEYGSQADMTGGKITLLKPNASQPPAGGTISVASPDDVLQVGKQLTFSTVGTEQRPARTLTLNNTGNQPLAITGLNFTGGSAAAFQLANGQASTFTIPAGGSAPVNIVFRPPSYTGFERYATLTINSSDSANPAVAVRLAGLHLNSYEGAFEPRLYNIWNVLGFGTQSGSTNYVLSKSNLPIGDEIISPYFKRADASKPVQLIPIGRFENRTTTAGGSTGWYNKPATTSTAIPTRQSLFNYAGGPEATGGGENQKIWPVPTGNTSFNPAGAFGIYNSYSSFSDDRFNLHPVKSHDKRFYPAKRADGTVIPNVYLAVSDPNGDSGKTWDYNDEMEILINATPEITTATTPTPYTKNFTESVVNTVLDAAGLGTGFTGVQANTAGNSYDASKITLNTSGAGTLSIASSTGTFVGGFNTQKNALEVAFDATTKAKPKVGTSVIGPFTNMDDNEDKAGVYFGPDQDNYVALYLERRNGTLTFVTDREEGGTRTEVSAVAVPNAANATSIQLYLEAQSVPCTWDTKFTCSTGQIVPYYRVTTAGGQGAQTALPTVPAIYDRMWWLSRNARVGIFTGNGTGDTPFTAKFDFIDVYNG